MVGPLLVLLLLLPIVIEFMVDLVEDGVTIVVETAEAVDMAAVDEEIIEVMMIDVEVIVIKIVADLEIVIEIVEEVDMEVVDKEMIEVVKVYNLVIFYTDKFVVF